MDDQHHFKTVGRPFMVAASLSTPCNVTFPAKLGFGMANGKTEAETL
jgi:hypothetical protein